MKKLLYTLYLAASVNGFAEITLTTEMDHENCNFTVLVNEDESVLYSETMHVDGQYMMTACWDSRVTACHVQLKDESYISGMKKNGTATFRNKENQICYFENLGLRTGNMGGFYSQPWSYIYNIDAKVSCEESSSIPLYCAKSEKMARQVLLASQELACKEKDGAFEGDVYAFERDDGSTEYCVSASCDVCDTRWRDEYMNRWKENECCKNRNKEPNLNNGTCVAPPAPGPGKIGVNYSKITAMPGCSEEDAGEGENFCEVPKSSSSLGSSSSQSSSSFSSSSVSSSSSLNSSSSGLSSSSSEKQEPAKCFPSNDEADVALLDARVTCESNGGVPNYSLDEYNCLVGSCTPPSSSSKAKSSSSEKVSSSSETFSSSEVSSSSKTSSSSANSSSSEIRSSSSSEIKVSSSSKIQSSSSSGNNPGYGICPDFPLNKVPNDPTTACFNYNGTCYKCNSSKYGSACSSDWLWIYSFQSHLVGDWYEKVSCETGKKEVEKGIGVCSAFPGSTPANVSACYAYNGSCYVCEKSESYIDCKADWLWNYNFPTHSWFKQVDCYDPYEEDDCPDPSYLLKKSVEIVNGENENYVNKSYSLDFVKPSKMYNVLGRNVKNPGKWEKVYEKKMNRNLSLVTDESNVVNTRYLLKLSTNSGHVSAKHDVSIKLRLTRREGCSSRADVIVTFITTVDKKPNYPNIDLQNHEMKHYDVYMEYDKIEYEEWYNLDANKSDNEACKEIKSYIWPNIRDLLTKLINEQNKIDDDDSKNECKDRISLQKTINEMKSVFDAKVCQEM